MSEYLSKKAVLEWFGLMHMEYSHNTAVSEFIESGIEIFESGAFDAPEMEHINAYWAREGLIKHQQEEIQRLRAALEMAQSELRWGDPINAIERVGRIIDKAISTATESTGQKDADDLIGDRIDERCPKCGADLLTNKVGDKWCSLVGCDYSINALEGDGNA